MGCIKKPRFNTLVVLICLLGLTGLSGSLAFGADEIGGWKWKADASVGLSYDTNIYRLSSTQSARFDQKRSSDQTSGRYKNMDSIDDFIFTPRVKATFKRSGLMGREFSIKPSVAYNVYTQSQEKNFFDFGLDLNQAVGKHGNLGLELGYTPNIYKKNYLSGATDKDLPGLTGHGISGSEKVFSPAHYDKTSIIASYGQRLWKSRKKQKGTLEPDALYGEIFAGYENKSYDDPFTVRTEDNLLAGMGLDIALHKNTVLSLNYLFKNIDTTVGTEVLIRNETNFGGVDFDKDGVIENINVATEQNVDRSRNQNTIGTRISTKLRKGWTGYAKYEARFTSYKSEERFDVTRLDRTDVRQKVGLGVKGELAPRWTLALSWVYINNQATRSGLVLVDKAEDKTYDRNIVSAIISYRL